jgi:hypothetical protein
MHGKSIFVFFPEKNCFSHKVKSFFSKEVIQNTGADKIIRLVILAVVMAQFFFFSYRLCKQPMLCCVSLLYLLHITLSSLFIMGVFEGRILHCLYPIDQPP